MSEAQPLDLVGVITILVAISVIDIRAKIIPNGLVLALAGLGALAAYCHGRMLPAIISGSIFFAIFGAIRTAHFIVTQRTGLGLGDVKMAFAVGIWLDFNWFPLFVAIASVSALFSVLVIYAVQGRSVLSQRIPFGPFLAVGMIACLTLQYGGLTPLGISADVL